MSDSGWVGPLVLLDVVVTLLLDEIAGVGGGETRLVG